MIGLNPLRTKVLITTDEVIFHAPTNNDVDPRIILSSIIVAERRFIKPMLCSSVYDGLVAAKNVLVTDLNKADLQEELNNGRGVDREEIVLQPGDYVNSDTYLSEKQKELWTEHLHKIVAECVWFVSLPVNRSRFTAKGVIKNYPESVASSQESATIDLKDLKHLLDKGLNERISPLMEDMHAYLCKTRFPGYDRDCECDSKGTAYKKSTGVLFGMYDDDDKTRRGW